MKTYLYINYPAEHYSMEQDSIFEELLAPHKARQVGSGIGMGTRDLDFIIPAPLDQEGLNKLYADLISAETMNVDFDLSQDAWDDEDADADGSIPEHDLQAG